MGTGHGWAGTDYVRCAPGRLTVQQPPTAQNFSFGHVGPQEASAYQRPPGFWASLGQAVAPTSLYFAQLRDRLGPTPAQAADVVARWERSARDYGA